MLGKSLIKYCLSKDMNGMKEKVMRIPRTKMGASSCNTKHKSKAGASLVYSKKIETM